MMHNPFTPGAAGPRPEAFEKPKYGTVGYGIAVKVGWITEEEEAADRASWQARRDRSLQTCHRYNLYERPRYPEPKDTGAYVPELSARLENDRNLPDGARRCLRKIAELAYRQNREGRSINVTVMYLAKALSRSRRTVQRYLRQLETLGYITADVLRSRASRLCFGLAVALMRPCFPRHHRNKWPGKTLGNPGASKLSQNQESYLYTPSQIWALKCMDGVL